MSQQVAPGRTSGAGGAPPPSDTAWYTLSVQDALARARVDPAAGLSSAEAAPAELAPVPVRS